MGYLGENSTPLAVANNTLMQAVYVMQERQQLALEPLDVSNDVAKQFAQTELNLASAHATIISLKIMEKLEGAGLKENSEKWGSITKDALKVILADSYDESAIISFLQVYADCDELNELLKVNENDLKATHVAKPVAAQPSVVVLLANSSFKPAAEAKGTAATTVPQSQPGTANTALAITMAQSSG